MIEIKNLLFKFNLLFLSKEIKINSLINIIKKTTGITIHENEIQIKGEIVYLKTKPIYKSEILLKKEEIVFLLKKSLGKRSPKNII